MSARDDERQGGSGPVLGVVEAAWAVWAVWAAWRSLQSGASEDARDLIGGG